MIRLIASIAVACVMAVAFADDKPKKTLTPEQKAANIARIKQKYYENTGGRVMNPNSGKGKIVFVNAQSKYSTVDDMVAELSMLFSLKMEVVDSKDTLRISELDKAAKDSGGATTVFIFENKELPLSLVAVESGWAVVNIAKLPEAPKMISDLRLKKELARAFALVSGIGYTAGAVNLMYPARAAQELDFCALPDKVNPYLISPIHKYLANLGVAPTQVATYRQACMQGWAPAPTNDVQRALWNRAKEKREAGPSNPIKILPPKKK